MEGLLHSVMFLSYTILSDHKNCVTATISEDLVMVLFAGNQLSSTTSSYKREGSVSAISGKDSVHNYKHFGYD